MFVLSACANIHLQETQGRVPLETVEGIFQSAEPLDHVLKDVFQMVRLHTMFPPLHVSK
jgi:hypothetical protein